MATKIQLRRGTATQWSTANPVLADGEVGYETDTGNIKIGTGVSGSGAWNNLPYYQLPNVSVNPATTADLSNAAYRVMGRYRLNSVTGGTTTWTNAPGDFAATIDADSVSTLVVTTHAYSALTTVVQQTLTQFSANNTDLKQWVRMYDGTNWTGWTSTAHLTDGEVTTAKIADDAVTAAKLADDASTDANRAVTTNHIRDSAVTTAKIADANVTTAKIADSNVTTAKIADSNVTTAKIADSSSTTTGVTNAKIRQSTALSVIGRSANTTGAPADIQATAASGAVLRESGNTIGFGQIATAGIADSAISTVKIAASAVTLAKIASSTVMPYPSASAGIGQITTSVAAPNSNQTAQISFTVGSGETWGVLAIRLWSNTGTDFQIITTTTNFSSGTTNTGLILIAIRLA